MAVTQHTNGDGTVSYQVRFGKKPAKWFNEEKCGGRKQAKQLATALYAELQKADGEVKRSVICGDYIERYLEDYEQQHKDSSYVAARSALRTFKREFGSLALEDHVWEQADAEKWARANRWAVPPVVTMFNRIVTRREIALTYNPFRGLSRKSKGRKDKLPLSPEELQQLAGLALAKLRDYGPMMRALILFAAYSGIRPGELFALEWSDLDFDRMRITVARRVYRGRLALPKNGRVREIVLMPEARDVLLTLPRGDHLVFRAKRGGMLSQSLLSGYWQPLATDFGKRADKNGRLEYVDFYELRHRCAYWLYVEQKMADRLVAVQLGHTDGGKLIRDLYGHGDHGALDEIDRLLGTASVTHLRAVGA